MPNSIGANAGNPLVLAISSFSAQGITSSAPLCSIAVPIFTVLTVPRRFHTGQSKTSRAAPILMFMATAPPRGTSDDNLQAVPVELGLGATDGLGKIVVIKCRVNNFVAVIFEVRWFDTAWDRMPAV